MSVDDLVPGTRVGRYVVASTLGVGAMGVVVAAHDPELDRMVALKLLVRTGKRARLRLRREAQALARLNHPNVIAVHDVGDHGDNLFISMEMIDGVTLRRWLKAADRPIEEIVEAFRAAGRGLAAAHAAGLVHRDFKPDNVMVAASNEGEGFDPSRIRVMDFGLVRQEDEVSSIGPDNILDLVERSPLSTRVTGAGGVVGTPQFMAPEQYASHDVGPAADQFSFCVALYHALTGEPPFPGVTRGELEQAVRLGRRSTSGGRKMPKRIAKAVERGLSVLPEERWPNMNELVAALGPRPSRLWWVVGGAGAMVAAAVAAWPADDPGCPDARGRLDGVWDADSKTRIQEAFAAQDLPYAADSWERAETRIDAWSEDLATAYEQTCRFSRDGGISVKEHDARKVCLDRGLSRLQATANMLERADADVVLHAVGAAHALPAVEVCSDPALRPSNHALPSDPAVGVVVNNVYFKLHECDALDSAGKVDEVRTCVRQLIGLAASTGYVPLMLRSRRLLAAVMEDDGEYEQAKRAYESLYFDASALRFDEVAAKAAQSRAFVSGVFLGDYDDASRWLEHARAAQPPGRTWSSIERTASLLARRRGDLDGAVAHAREALRLADQDQDLRYRPYALDALGRALAQQGKFDQAIAAARENLAAQIRLLGPDHPHVASAHNNLGADLLRDEQLEEALQHMQRAKEIRDATLSSEHPYHAATGMNLGNVLRRLGRYEEALEIQRESVEAFARLRGAESHEHGSAMVNLAATLFALKRDEEGLRVAEEGLGYIEAEKGRNANYAHSKMIVISFHRRRGRLDLALQQAQELIDDLRDHVDERDNAWTEAHLMLAFIRAQRQECESSLTALEVARPRSATGGEQDGPSEVEEILERCPRI